MAALVLALPQEAFAFGDALMALAFEAGRNTQ